MDQAIYENLFYPSHVLSFSFCVGPKIIGPNLRENKCKGGFESQAQMVLDWGLKSPIQ